MPTPRKGLTKGGSCCDTIPEAQAESGCRSACVKREWGLPVVPVPGSRTQTHSKERYSLLHHEEATNGQPPFPLFFLFLRPPWAPGLMPGSRRHSALTACYSIIFFLAPNAPATEPSVNMALNSPTTEPGWGTVPSVPAATLPWKVALNNPLPSPPPMAVPV